MSGLNESGAQPRALWPAAWKYYDPLVATIGLLLMVTNALMGLEVFSNSVDRWISVGIGAVMAFLIWLRARATQLGVIKIDHAQAQAPPEETHA